MGTYLQSFRRVQHPAQGGQFGIVEVRAGRAQARQGRHRAQVGIQGLRIAGVRHIFSPAPLPWALQLARGIDARIVQVSEKIRLRALAYVNKVQLPLVNRGHASPQFGPPEKGIAHLLLQLDIQGHCL